MLRNVTESQKKRVAGRQRYTCAASITEYTCPMKGEPFDESGYEIDHIDDIRHHNNIDNLRLFTHSQNMKKAYARKRALKQQTNVHN